MNVKEFIEESKELLSTDIDARGLEMQLFSPDGYRVNGNTLISTVRSFEPISTDEENKPLELFFSLLENCGLDDVTFMNASRLYYELNEIVDDSLSESLIKSENKILTSSL